MNINKCRVHLNNALNSLNVVTQCENMGHSKGVELHIEFAKEEAERALKAFSEEVEQVNE